MVVHPKYRLATALVTGLAAILAVGTVRDPDFWRTPDQRGDAFLRARNFSDAEKAYADPWRIGVAQYRTGSFEAAAKTFARVPGAPGAFDAGNAWLMHGKYDQAIAAYDRALGFRPGWKEAEENRALAAARRDALAATGEDREEGEPSDKPDDVVFDQKGGGEKKPQDLAGGAALSDAALQATWLRRVQTTPGDFLEAKFAYEAQSATAAAGVEPEKGTP
jgi:Ca-activated chloride channel family protein